MSEGWPAEEVVNGGGCYARSILPSVWSSVSKVIVAAFGILVSGSRATLEQ